MAKKFVIIFVALLCMVSFSACQTKTDIEIETIEDFAEDEKDSTVPITTTQPPNEATKVSKKGNMAIYNQGRRADLTLGMTLQEAEDVLASIGYDKTNKDYHTWRNHNSQYITYKDFSFQTFPVIENNITKDYVSWIYIKSSDYQTSKGLKVGASSLDIKNAYGDAENVFGTYNKQLPIGWIEEPFPASSTEVLEWKREDYYFFTVIADMQMAGYGIALDNFQIQQELFEKDRNENSFVYENKLAGFSIVLPGSWKNYFYSNDTQEGTSFFYYKEDALDAPYMFVISSELDSDADSPIQAGIAHNKMFTSTISTDANLDRLKEWDWAKSNQMMKDRSTICKSFQEIPIDKNAEGNFYDNSVKGAEVFEKSDEINLNVSDDFTYKIDTYQTGFGEFPIAGDSPFDYIRIIEETEYYSIDFSYPQYRKGDFPYSVELCNSEIKKLAEQITNEGRELFPKSDEDLEDYQYEIERWGMLHFGIDGFFESYTLNQRYISVRFGGGYDVGANHPMGFLSTICWDLKTNQLITISDIFKNPEIGLNKLSELARKAMILESAKPEPIIYVDENSIEFKTGVEATVQNFSNFALGKEEIYLYFPPYTVTSYASSGGAAGFRVAIPYNLLSDELLIEY